MGAPLRSALLVALGTAVSLLPAVHAEGAHVEPESASISYSSNRLSRLDFVGLGGEVGSRLVTGGGHVRGWPSFSGVDLDGDGQDELFSQWSVDGSFRLFIVGSAGEVGSLLVTGRGHVSGWPSFSGVDLDGDGQDELLSYRRSHGSLRLNYLGSDGDDGSAASTGEGHARVSSIITIDFADLRCAPYPFTDERVAALELRYPSQSVTAYVYDTRSECAFSLNPDERLRTASVFKVMVMAGTLLEAQNEGRELTSWERGQLVPMITESANSPVRGLWRSFGGSPWFSRQAQLFGLDDTNAVGDGAGPWGTTTTSAEDQVDLLRQVLLGDWGPLERRYRGEAWDLMTSVVASQTWGVTAGVPEGWTVAQKNGFAGGVANSVGFVREPNSEDGYFVAILTNGWRSWQAGVPVVEEIASWVSTALAR